MKYVCAWRQADLGQTDSETDSKHAVTRGVCDSCAANLSSIAAERAEPLHDFLDRLEVPVLLVESEPRVLAGNKLARDLLGKGVGEISECGAGDVIECINASKPGGCGREVHCKTCTIRNTVTETFETGREFVHVQAFPDVQVGQAVKTMSLEISTEKVADVVLLRIDDFSEAPAASPGQSANQ